MAGKKRLIASAQRINWANKTMNWRENATKSHFTITFCVYVRVTLIIANVFGRISTFISRMPMCARSQRSHFNGTVVLFLFCFVCLFFLSLLMISGYSNEWRNYQNFCKFLANLPPHNVAVRLLSLPQGCENKYAKHDPDWPIVFAQCWWL